MARNVTERIRYMQAIERQNEKLKEISWLQSHVIRAPLARIMALVPMIENETGSTEDRMHTLRYLRISADELDKVIREITNNSQSVDISNEI
ncbi:MAG: hypothetical protein M3O71_28285 [Bacteroidota bacterium]|nr:hypothetical protein [Bacteroidota bacterium]